MIDILNGITTYFGALLANRPVLAVVLGLVTSLGLTQWAKFVYLKSERVPGAPATWMIRAFAMPVGAVTTSLALPHEMETLMRVLIGIAVGVAAPYVYKLIMAVLPDSIANKLSVDPYGEAGDGK